MGSLFQRNRNGYGNLVLKSCFLEEVVVATYSDRGWMTKQIKGKVGGGPRKDIDKNSKCFVLFTKFLAKNRHSVRFREEG